MAITKLTPKQIQSVINETYNQMTGKDPLATIDIEGVIDVGVEEIKDLRDNFTGGLLVRLTKLWYTDEKYRGKIGKLYFEDKQTFGAICEYISVTPPPAIENSSWKAVNGSQVGVYTIYAPQVNTRYFVKSDVYEIPLDIKENMLRKAFSNNEELANFVSYCWLVLDNSITAHVENMSALARNSFIATKLIKMYAEGNTKMHVYDFVRAYVDFAGIQTTYTVKMALNDPDFLRWSSTEMGELVKFLELQTNKFNDGDNVKFVPEDRLVVEILSKFVSIANAVAYSGTFNADLVKLPNYNATTSWQACDTMKIEDLGRIKVQLDETTTVDTRTYGNTSNTIVLGVALDKFCIAHTSFENRVASQYLSVEDVTINRAQFEDRYLQNTELPAIVFTMSDVIVS